ncbi:hypothetical protein Pint_27019 [Pistacia integerrima]|uniref:Uncharacterized protein n=1 Tax=Pistacia integerrima TaxID=434235 RepID=A0ACC0YT35_9ROSI|nr:hypothetical protein Pint_27019 [Pistacia integerrima]
MVVDCGGCVIIMEDFGAAMTKVRAQKEKGVENFGAMCSKLRALKECLKHWNKNVFGDVHSKVEKVRSLVA